jgi:hypothetical protein
MIEYAIIVHKWDPKSDGFCWALEVGVHLRLLTILKLSLKFNNVKKKKKLK